MATLSHQCPLLTHLSVDSSTSYTTFDRSETSLSPEEQILTVSISESITRLCHLQSVNIQSVLNATALLHLATLSSLDSLIILSEASAVALCKLMVGPNTYGPVFPALRTLSLNKSSAVGMAPLFKSIRSPHFEDISLKVRETTPDVVRDIVESVSNAPYSATLKMLVLSNLLQDSFTTPVSKVTINVLRPLTRLSSLRTLKLIIDDLDLDDAAVKTLASALPYLTTLILAAPTDLTNGRDHHRTPKITLNALDDLVKYCPDLYHVQLDFDTRIVPQVDEPVRTRCDSRLVSIRVGYRSSKAHPEKVARYLWRITQPPSKHDVDRLRTSKYENADTVKTMAIEFSDLLESWQEVNQWLRRLRQTSAHGPGCQCEPPPTTVGDGAQLSRLYRPLFGEPTYFSSPEAWL